MDFITIDFETATSDADSACEIGLSFVKDNKVVDTRSWLIKPLCYPRFNYWNVKIHGIRPEDVSDALEFHQIWKEIEPLIEDQFLIAHNASFDFTVLRKTLDAYGLQYPRLQYACSVRFTRLIWTGLTHYNLKALCNMHNIQFRHHRAASDAQATAEMVLKAFHDAEINSLEDFSNKLKIIPAQLFPGGHQPPKTVKRSRRKYTPKPAENNFKHSLNRFA